MRIETVKAIVEDLMPEVTKSAEKLFQEMLGESYETKSHLRQALIRAFVERFMDANFDKLAEMINLDSVAKLANLELARKIAGNT